MRKNNTQLPVEVEKQIEQQAIEYASTIKSSFGISVSDLRNYSIIDYTAGATEYATNLHLEQQDKAALKAKGDKLALALRRLSRSVSVHPEYSNDSEWCDYVTGANKSLDEWEGLKKLTPEEVNQKPGAEFELVFAPCAENDPRAVGRYTSHDGESHCNVREMYVPAIKQQGAVWVKASERLPGWLQPVKWRVDGIERKLQTVSYLAHDECPANIPDYEWFDESSSDAVERLQQIKLTDIDAPIFTHTKEFAAHFSYIKGKFIDILNCQSK